MRRGVVVVARLTGCDRGAEACGGRYRMASPSVPSVLLYVGPNRFCPHQRTTNTTRQEASSRRADKCGLKKLMVLAGNNFSYLPPSLSSHTPRLFFLLFYETYRTTSPALVTTPPSFPTPPVATRRSDSARPPAPSLSVLPAAS